MAVSVVMPALEMAQESGKLVSWLKREGEQVRKGDMLLEVETDKAVVEVEASSDGILAGITAQPGDVIPVGHTIAWLVQPGESPPSSTSAHVLSGRRTDASPVAAASVAASEPSTPAAVRISPKARRLAKEHGVDLSQVRGSGPGGEILADDILAAAERVRLKPDTTYGSEPVRLKPDTTYGSEPVRLKPDTTSESRPTDVVSGFSRTVETKTEPVTTIGRLMAERTTQSWTSVPHFFVTREVDAGALKAARDAMLPAVEKSHAVKVTFTDVIVRAAARTLKRHPRLNASWTGDNVVVHSEINVALAMAVENAVVTGVIPHADAMPVAEIAVRRRDLMQRATVGRLRPEDVGGGTFTISNLGMYDVDAFTAIIVPPQAAILAVGAVVDRVVAVDGKAAVRPMMTVTLSCDHRVVDGARAAEFLRDLVSALHATEP
jgi:pyruvate dehydrogenase E2 component (dihydrolipoamide acetyltransferase)